MPTYNTNNNWITSDSSNSTFNNQQISDILLDKLKQNSVASFIEKVSKISNILDIIIAGTIVTAADTAADDDKEMQSESFIRNRSKPYPIQQ
ncbi:hypothetical protein EWB00_004108 [Schistosoma japonicum]|uniref:Uncharacterized protein n=1 Tax=Schistosoma japonicum TaxID=6182 RepID=A0A4Z2D6G1_SCHJA|nr:hypothetical protein EWB00_004108 [Schistosoma japonicum]